MASIPRLYISKTFGASEHCGVRASSELKPCRCPCDWCASCTKTDDRRPGTTCDAQRISATHKLDWPGRPESLHECDSAARALAYASVSIPAREAANCANSAN